MIDVNNNEYVLVKKFAISKMKRSKNNRHDHRHVIRVKNNALKIIKYLDLEGEVNKNLLKTICLLHDFTYTERKSGLLTYVFEGHFVKKLIGNVLEKFDITEDAKGIITDAVYHHTHSFPFKRLNKTGDIYSKILQDADTLDYFNRVRVGLYMKESGRGIVGKLKKFFGARLVEYGKVNLANFLNYPILAKMFFTDTL